jgi:glycine/D-amino acid oxidase-like deaminating enzyme
MSRRPSVAVVGAGCAGLAAACALKARGIPFIVFEAREGLGGTWRYDAALGNSSGYASLTSNTSRRNTSFRSFRLPPRGPAFVHHTEMLRYLERFADYFDLWQAIRFSAPVRRVRLTSGGWNVDGERFDAVVVATGYNNVPRTPDIPGSLDGLVLHTRDYRTPDAFRGREVVVVGMGCSAAELACEIADVAACVTLAVRSGSDVTARRLGPIPVDWFDTRGGSRIPFSVRRVVFRALVRMATGDQVAAGLPVGPMRFADKPFAVSDRLVGLVREGTIAVKPQVVQLLGDRVRFADDSEQPTQALLLATGYETVFPFLDADADAPTYEQARLYRGVASLTPGLFFIGIVGAHGALIPLMEAQAEWVGEVLAGHLVLPSEELMRMSIERDREIRQRDFDTRYALFRDRLRYVRALEAEVRHARRHPGEPARRAGAATTA